MGTRFTHASLALAAITVAGCTRPAATDVEIERTALTTTTETFSVTTPQGIPPANTFLSATNRLQVDDRNTLGTATTLETIANFGSNGLEIGSAGPTPAPARCGTCAACDSTPPAPGCSLPTGV